VKGRGSMHGVSLTQGVGLGEGGGSRLRPLRHNLMRQHTRWWRVRMIIREFNHTVAVGAVCGRSLLVNTATNRSAEGT